MASAEEWSGALQRFGLAEEHQSALAGHLSQTRVPTSHVQNLSAIHVASREIPKGAQAMYRHGDRSVHVGDPAAAARVGPGVERKFRRDLVHEIGHGVGHTLNPQQFGRNMRTPAGRGYVEAQAENYADQAMPESHSGYDYTVSTGRNAHFDAGTYRAGRAGRYGNIDPRLA